VFLKTPQVRFEQAESSFGIPRIRAGSSQTDYPALLLVHNAPRFGDMLLGTAKVVLVVHTRKIGEGQVTLIVRLKRHFFCFFLLISKIIGRAGIAINPDSSRYLALQRGGLRADWML
jgi:hypothetical protein